MTVCLFRNQTLRSGVFTTKMPRRLKMTVIHLRLSCTGRNVEQTASNKEKTILLLMWGIGPW